MKTNCFVVHFIFIIVLKAINWFCDINVSSVLPEIGSEHGKSVFLLLSKIKAVPSLEAQKDMVKWVLQVGYLISHILFLTSHDGFCCFCELVHSFPG